MTEQEVRENLAYAYQFLAEFKLDDLTYTHLSARIPGEAYFYIFPFGCLFSEVTEQNLLTVTLEGKVLQGSEVQYNKTGYVIHGNIYRAREDINAIFHLHTPMGVAVSAMECGLLPLSQFSLHFYNRIAYHAYNSLALDDKDHGVKLVKDLAMHKVMMLRNHGTLSCGSTIHEAFFYAYYLEQACRVQCMALASGQSLIYPPSHICEKAALDMRAFEVDLGYRDWQALKKRFLKRNKLESNRGFEPLVSAPCEGSTLPYG